MSAQQRFKNNADSTVNGTIAVGAGFFNVAAGHGSRFPSLGAGEYSLVTLYEKNTAGVDFNFEVVKVTAVSGDTLTISRDFEGLVVGAGGTSGGWAYPSPPGLNPSQIVYVQMRYTAFAAGNTLTKDGNLAGVADPAEARANLGLDVLLDTKVSKTSDTGAMHTPVGTTAQRPVAPDLKYGDERTNSDTNSKEWWNGTSWVDLVSDPSSFATKASPTFTGTVTLPQIINITQPYGEVLIAGVPAMRVGGANGDNSGQLAGFRNILLNPRVGKGINQREVTSWDTVAIGAYGYDCWKKYDASTIVQSIPWGSYEPSTVYTLSGVNVITQQVISPASGTWVLPPIANSADYVQLEAGYIASDRENKLGLEIVLCRQWFRRHRWAAGDFICQLQAYSTTGAFGLVLPPSLPMRAIPAISHAGAGTFRLRDSTSAPIMCIGGSFSPTAVGGVMTGGMVVAGGLSMGNTSVLSAGADCYIDLSAEL